MAESKRRAIVELNVRGPQVLADLKVWLDIAKDVGMTPSTRVGFGFDGKTITLAAYIDELGTADA